LKYFKNLVIIIICNFYLWKILSTIVSIFLSYLNLIADNAWIQHFIVSNEQLNLMIFVYSGHMKMISDMINCKCNNY